MESKHEPIVPSKAEASLHLAELDAAETELFTARRYPSWFALYTGLCYGIIAGALYSNLGDVMIVAIAIGASTMHAAAIIPMVLRQGSTPQVWDAPGPLKRQLIWYLMLFVVVFALIYAVGSFAPWWLTALVATVVIAGLVQLQIERVRNIGHRISATRSEADAL